MFRGEWFHIGVQEVPPLGSILPLKRGAILPVYLIIQIPPLGSICPLKRGAILPVPLAMPVPELVSLCILNRGPILPVELTIQFPELVSTWIFISYRFHHTFMHSQTKAATLTTSTPNT